MSSCPYYVWHCRCGGVQAGGSWVVGAPQCVPERSTRSVETCRRPGDDGDGGKDVASYSTPQLSKGMGHLQDLEHDSLGMLHD